MSSRSTPSVAVEEIPAFEVRDLKVSVQSRTGAALPAVRSVSFAVRAGETLGIVGESGCGKSLTLQAAGGLLPPVAHVAGGEVRLEGEDLLRLDPSRRRRSAGPGIAFVFQDALRTLNPVQTVGAQLAEPFRIHGRMSRRSSRERAIQLMARVGIPDAAARSKAYPFEFSGGMCQRLLIAMAVALEPRVLLADEPTTALDVTVQAQIMDLLEGLCAEHRMALVLVSHDLAILSRHVDHVLVMYAGTVVESGPVREVLSSPRHPYTQGLVASVPTNAISTATRLQSISGAPPALHAMPEGCAFASRCALAQEICRREQPPLIATDDGRSAACHFVGAPA